MASRRGTSNSNERGSAEQRRRRKAWLIETYRANVDVATQDLLLGRRPRPVLLGTGTPAAYCYRCPTLLTFDTITVDRIIPGCKGGTYRRNNIRPACSFCNSSTGGKLAAERRAA